MLYPFNKMANNAPASIMVADGHCWPPGNMNAIVRRIAILRGAYSPAGRNSVPDLQREQERAERYLRQSKAHSWLTRMAFVCIVIAPTILGTIYYGLFAAKQYVSEGDFLVRNTSSQRLTGLDRLISTFGISTTADDGYAVEKYLTSREAIEEVSAGVDLRTAYRCRGIDRFSCYNSFWSIFRKDTFESLYEYVTSRILVIRDASRGITSLRVVAYSPKDAQLIAQLLLKAAEKKVNSLNARAMGDAVSQAQITVHQAEQHVLSTQRDLTRFRNQQMIVDAGKASTSQAENIASLEADLALTRTQAGQAEKTAPGAPALKSLTARISAIQRQIEAERSKLVGAGSQALSNKLGEYERLTLLRKLADQEFALAMSALQAARDEARRQHVYIESIVHPNLPDDSTEPRRIRGILTVFVSSFAIFAVLWILSIGAREHVQ